MQPKILRRPDAADEPEEALQESPPRGPGDPQGGDAAERGEEALKSMRPMSLQA